MKYADTIAMGIEADKLAEAIEEYLKKPCICPACIGHPYVTTCTSGRDKLVAALKNYRGNNETP